MAEKGKAQRQTMNRLLVYTFMYINEYYAAPRAFMISAVTLAPPARVTVRALSRCGRAVWEHLTQCLPKLVRKSLVRLKPIVAPCPQFLGLLRVGLGVLWGENVPERGAAYFAVVRFPCLHLA